VRPVEADGRHTCADLVGPQQRGQGFRHAAEQRSFRAGVGLFACLDLLPLLEDLGGRADLVGRAEDVRMASNQLLADGLQRVGHGESPFVRLDLRQEDTLEEQVADLAQERHVILAIDRVEHFVGLLEHEAAQRLERLLVIPWAPARAAQPRHDVDELLERRTRGRLSLLHRATMLAFDGVADQDSVEPGLTFTGFILSLATTAAIHFGDIADPTTGEPGAPDLAAAGQMIELIAMLQDKTKGNLTDEEARIVDDLLYELRLRFVKAQQGERRIVEP